MFTKDSPAFPPSAVYEFALRIQKLRAFSEIACLRAYGQQSELIEALIQCRTETQYLNILVDTRRIIKFKMKISVDLNLDSKSMSQRMKPNAIE